VEVREDVLVYASEPVDEPIEITGPVGLRLFASSSAPDTDFTAKLVNVRPDGYAQNIAEGILRVRFRDPSARPSLTTPGEILDLTIPMGEYLPGRRAGGLRAGGSDRPGGRPLTRARAATYRIAPTSCT